MNYLDKIITDIEVHSVEGIKDCFRNGINPNDLYKGRPLIYELITGYGRGPKFKECFNTFVESGLLFDDKALQAVFLDDASLLESQLKEDSQAIKRKYSLSCAFTPLKEASLLHICAEFNHLSCARMLVKYGLGINTRAGTDDNGFGGQTPIFHTVNQHANLCLEMMKFLISESADLTITVKGIVWGKGYEWETFIPSVNPISYAMMGLLPQFQRTEKNIYEAVSILLKAAYGIEYAPSNVPNRYLRGRKGE